GAEWSRDVEEWRRQVDREVEPRVRARAEKAAARRNGDRVAAVAEVSRPEHGAALASLDEPCDLATVEPPAFATEQPGTPRGREDDAAVLLRPDERAVRGARDLQRRCRHGAGRHDTACGQA